MLHKFVFVLHLKTLMRRNRIDTLVHAAEQHKSVSFPRPSYDGRFLCYTLSDYGQFSIWHHEADLWLLDLTTGESRIINDDTRKNFGVRKETASE